MVLKNAQTADTGLCSVQVIAEKRAMQLAAEIGVKLIAICPNFILGPPLSTRIDGTSVGYMKVTWQMVPCICCFVCAWADHCRIVPC